MSSSASSSRLLRAARGGSLEQLKLELQGLEPSILNSLTEPNTGLTALHLAAAVGQEECVDALLEAQADVLALDAAGCTPLHVAAQGAIPMCAYQLASRAPAACLEQNAQKKTPIDLAAASEKGEVLNAMLLACSGHATPEALASMRSLLEAGAVCDTWAPNGSSALMLAASVDCSEGVQLLLDNSASLELQDALGRTALMFAAGNNARKALEALLDRGASVSIRDRRGRNVVDYAAADSEVRRVLEERIAEMESKAARLQEELLAELLDAEATQKERPSKKSKKKKGKQGKAKSAAAAAAAAAPADNDSAAAAAEVAEQEAPQAALASEAGSLQASDSEPPPECSEQQPEQLHDDDMATARKEAAEELAAAAAAAGASAAGEASEPDVSYPERAPSPDWQVVGRTNRHTSSCSQHHHHQFHHHHAHAHQHHHRETLEAGMRPMQRCPSASSLGSSCSGESHDTAGSSQRSVLISLSRASSAARGPCAAKAAVLGQPAAAAAVGPVKPAWGKVAAVPAGQLAQPEGHGLEDEAYPPLVAAKDQQPQLQPQPPVQPEAETQPCSEPAAQQQAFSSPSSRTGAQQPAGDGDGDGAAGSAGHGHAGAQAEQPGAEEAQAAASAASLACEAQPNYAALAAEVAALHAQVARLQIQQQQAQLLHQEELAAVLEDTAAHEAAAVAEAVAAERLNCIYRFAAFLQNNNLAADLLASHGLSGAAGSLPSSSLPIMGARVPPRPPAPSFPPAAASGGSSSLDFLGFPPTDPHRGRYTAPAPCAAAAAATAAAPFCFSDLEQRLRTEYSGDTSHFVVPASEAEAAVPLPLSLF